MPKDFLYETAVTIDHEDGIMLVDTTVASIATALRRAGFTETTKPESRPYRRFKGSSDQIRFRKPKTERMKALKGSAAQKVASQATAGQRNQAKISPISTKPIPR